MSNREFHPAPAVQDHSASADYSSSPNGRESQLNREKRKPGARALPIVNEHNFIQATRDTGYRSIAAAVAEIIDNALQAEATRVQVFVRPAETPSDGILVAILDNGVGMDSGCLQTALQFGGSGRFGDRSGLGRFGMGLPNSSVSQARRLDVFTWKTPDEVLHAYLDVDEISSGSRQGVKLSRRRVAVPSWIPASSSASGTLVVWSRCDRLPYRRPRTIARKLLLPLGQWYRYHLWGGVQIHINEESVEPRDPLFRRPPPGHPRSIPFGEPLDYEVKVPGNGRSSPIRVRFVELPIEEWQNLDVEEKRRLGVIGGAGVSIIRAGREIDYGWLLMGGKRRENYDDWWRCEIRFEPELDELFGVTHSKQGVSPTSTLRAILSPDLERIARLLNARVRSRFAEAKTVRPSVAVTIASERDRLLPPPAGLVVDSPNPVDGLRYRIVAESGASDEFFMISSSGGTVTVILNQNHPFFERVYVPACASPNPRERFGVEALVLSAARASLEIPGSAGNSWADHYQSRWSDALAAFVRR